MNAKGLADNINPIDHAPSLYTDVMKTQGLKQALDAHGFDGAIGGARRDEEASRAKERVFSFRAPGHRWDPRQQRPEMWRLLNGRLGTGETARIFPLSNWTERDVWRYILRERLDVVPLYFAAERPVVERSGQLIVLDDDRMPLAARRETAHAQVRFRTLGCWPLTPPFRPPPRILKVSSPKRLPPAPPSARAGSSITIKPARWSARSRKVISDERARTHQRGPGPGAHGIVHILTCGSVDDGKSTLIGRLLWDASDLPDDERERVRRAARAAGNPDKLDYSLLLDGLVAEREQGITIDIAWRYLDTEKRRVVLIDSPGHDQYTRNMASGASHADAAIMLIDARHGLKRQTRRHAAILQLMGVPRVVLAVNKMDLVDWSESRFREIERDFAGAVAGLGFVEARAIPVSARNGDNVAAPSGNAPWYEGPTLVAHLESTPSRHSPDTNAFRMPVQTVLRDGQDFRGLAGTVSSGKVRVGDEVTDALTGRSARVERIATMDGDLDEAAKGKAVVLVLGTDLDVARGAVLAAPGALPVKARSVEGRIVWVAEQPFGAAHSLLLKTPADLVPVAAIEVTGHIELETLSLKVRQPMLRQRHCRRLDHARPAGSARSIQ